MDIWLHKDLIDTSNAANQQQAFQKFMTIQGHVFRQRDGRCTQLITLNDNHYFIKQFSSISWMKLIKSLFFLKLSKSIYSFEFLKTKSTLSI